jgi:hypothetical protein
MLPGEKACFDVSTTSKFSKLLKDGKCQNFFSLMNYNEVISGGEHLVVDACVFIMPSTVSTPTLVEEGWCEYDFAPPSGGVSRETFQIKDCPEAYEGNGKCATGFYTAERSAEGTLKASKSSNYLNFGNCSIRFK